MGRYCPNCLPWNPLLPGFIIQLFVVPGMIVLAVVGVWALFGKLAAGEQDWQSLVVELSNSNEHRRWRGAHGLAQILQADRQSKSTKPKLAQNQVVIAKLTELFEQELAKQAPQENDVQFQAFLARTMGLLESNERVIPVLREAMKPSHDREVRKNAVASVALIASRSDEKGSPLENKPLVDDLVDVSADSDPLMRQIAAYTLGLVSSDVGNERLIVMLDDPDENTRLNAAIALARHQSTEGLRVLEAVLKVSTGKFSPVGLSETNPVERTKEENNQRYQRNKPVTEHAARAGDDCRATDCD